MKEFVLDRLGKSHAPLLVFVTLLCTVVTPASSAVTGSTEWLCNAAGASFSRNGLSITEDRTINGRIVYLSEDNSTEWGAMASINFLRDRADRNFGGLSVYRKNAGDKFLTVRLAGYGQKPRDFAKIQPSQALQFHLSIDSEGTVAVTANGLTTTAPGKPIKAGIAQVSCSSGRFQFSELSTPIINY